MKKIRLILVLTTIICLLNTIVFAIGEIKNNDYEAIYTSEKSNSNSGAFHGYVIRENELYVNLWILYDNKTARKCVFKYVNGQLIDMELDEKEAEKYYEEAKSMYDLDSEDNKIIINEKRYIELGEVDNPRITLIEGQKERYLGGYVFSTPIPTYMYLDKENEKLYFAGGGVKKVRGKYESTRGILVYDIKTGDVSNFALSENTPRVENMSIEQEKTRDFEDYSNPIKVPNTPYLLFYIEKRVDNKYFYEIAIKEVPKWKSEIALQEKNKKENPKAKTAYTNGSANVRDNPKGKVISALNDWTEVLILEQKNDWYHILYADIEGWTYKDNIRQAE
jgi:hypothetical protein